MQAYCFRFYFLLVTVIIFGGMVEARQAEIRSLDIVCLASMEWLQCRPHRGWRILLVEKRWRMPTLPEGVARASDLRPQQRPAS